MDHKTNIPGIRFKGFQNEWNRQVLGELAEKVTDKNGNGMISETFTNSAEHGVISQRDFFDHDISKAGKTNGYYVIQNNDFVYNPRISVTAPCGPINCNRLGRSGVMSPLYTVFRTHDVDTLYLEWFFKSDIWHSYMRFNGDSGARSDRFSIKSELFFNMPIPMPEAEEQCMVGMLLQDVNNHFTSLQKKSCKLHSIRASMLEKMFPRNGAKVPEVRFAGYSGKWEYRTFSSLFQEYSEKNHSELPVLTIIQGKGTIPREDSTRYVTYDKSAISSYKLVRQGDFIVHLRSFEGGLEKANSDGIVSPAYHILHGIDISTQFYYLYFRSFDFIHHKLKNCVYGIRDGRSIDIDEMMKIEIPYTSIDEQQAIGQFFSKLDGLISLTQSEIEKLQQFKKALLSKMFV